MRERAARLLIVVTYGAGLLLLVLILLSASVRIEDWVFRHRAERLFNDIQSIDVTQSTFQQVGSIFVRWDSSGDFVQPCSEQRCDFETEIIEPAVWHNDSTFFLIFLSFYRFLGGHPAIARANVVVQNGYVQAKHYSLSIEAPPVVGADGRSLIYYVEGNISTEPQTEANNPALQSVNGRPGYEIGSNACLGCVEIHVKFTPAALPADVRRLSQINFSCLTRQHPCCTREEIMPNAASGMSREIQPSRASP
jgi:hypothetical protein